MIQAAKDWIDEDYSDRSNFVYSGFNDHDEKSAKLLLVRFDKEIRSLEAKKRFLKKYMEVDPKNCLFCNDTTGTVDCYMHKKFMRTFT